MRQGLSHCLQIFPTPDINKTSEYYKYIGFRADYYLESIEPHVCLYRDAIEIVLTKSIKENFIPNRILHGYGYDAYFISNEQRELENELKNLGINIVRPLSKTDYNNKEFVFEDIDGRWIAVGNKEQ
ncbi:MAG: glyoxalase [Candidatus Cohnella colombiensis]|uniref:Glyoxalase n=1 Tax=Candidatus Cohnella colombiensis TaxID=3121368 RepID=A0AA95JC20_9BACL|nr:MAG: glyoxalase [Cohnella sp.]